MNNSSLNNGFSITDIVPNYKAGLSIPSPYTVEMTGVVVGTANQLGFSSIYVDGVHVVFQGSGGSYYASSGEAIVGKGNVVTASGWGTLTFYPLKGAKNG